MPQGSTTESAPYLSVVTILASAPGTDRCERVRRFVRDFDEQCGRTGLDAEVIVVDWNADGTLPPCMPSTSHCVCRSIEVPADVHRTLRHADVLDAFPAIARNVGLRRARGRFVLATNVDVMFPTELIAHLASRPLRSGQIYRVDGRDVDPDRSSGAPLDARLAHAGSHQHAIHTRAGTIPVDPIGAPVSVDADIADGSAIRLGYGWHLCAGDGGERFRWAGERAEVIVRPGSTPQVLEIDMRANPSEPRAWAALDVMENGRAVARAHLTGRMTVLVPIEPMASGDERRLTLHVTRTHAKSRRRLPVFERREDLCYQVLGVRLRAAEPDRSMIEHPLDSWTNANPKSVQTVTRTADGLLVSSDRPKWSYSMHYGLLHAPATATYRFQVALTVLEGRVIVGVLNGRRDGWLPASVSVQQEAAGLRVGVSLDVVRGTPFWLMIYNDHPDGDAASRYLIRRLTASVEAAQLTGGPASRLQRAALMRPIVAAYKKVAAPLRKLASPGRWREWRAAAQRACADWMLRVLPASLRERLVRRSQEYRSLDTSLHLAADAASRLAPLGDLAGLDAWLRDHRPPNLHVDACGDFQLMAREHWHDLRGYLEIEGFDTHVDALLAFSAAAAGVEEVVLPMSIYRLQAVDAGVPIDPEVLARRRMAERNVPRLDPAAVSIWASQMQWLKRPLMFNSADWGMAHANLTERAVPSPIGSAS